MTDPGAWDIVGSCPRLIFSRCDKFVKVSTGPGRQLRASANNKGYMKTITYKNKKLKLPYDLTEGEATADMTTRMNPFSGQSIDLPRFAAIIYDTVIDLNLKAERKDSATKQTPGFSEHQDDWQKVRNGINFFRQYFAKEYMVLLD